MKLTGGVGVAGMSTTALGSGGAQSNEDEGQTRKRTNIPAWGVKNTNQYWSAPKYLEDSPGLEKKWQKHVLNAQAQLKLVDISWEDHIDVKGDGSGSFRFTFKFNNSSLLGILNHVSAPESEDRDVKLDEEDSFTFRDAESGSFSGAYPYATRDPNSGPNTGPGDLYWDYHTLTESFEIKSGLAGKIDNHPENVGIEAIRDRNTYSIVPAGIIIKLFNKLLFEPRDFDAFEDVEKPENLELPDGNVEKRFAETLDSSLFVNPTDEALNVSRIDHRSDIIWGPIEEGELQIAISVVLAAGGLLTAVASATAAGLIIAALSMGWSTASVVDAFLSKPGEPDIEYFRGFENGRPIPENQATDTDVDVTGPAAFSNVQFNVYVPPREIGDFTIRNEIVMRSGQGGTGNEVPCAHNIWNISISTPEKMEDDAIRENIGKFIGDVIDGEGLAYQKDQANDKEPEAVNLNGGLENYRSANNLPLPAETVGTSDANDESIFDVAKTKIPPNPNIWTPDKINTGDEVIFDAYDSWVETGAATFDWKLLKDTGDGEAIEKKREGYRRGDTFEYTFDEANRYKVVLEASRADDESISTLVETRWLYVNDPVIPNGEISTVGETILGKDVNFRIVTSNSETLISELEVAFGGTIKNVQAVGAPYCGKQACVGEVTFESPDSVGTYAAELVHDDEGVLDTTDVEFIGAPLVNLVPRLENSDSGYTVSAELSRLDPFVDVDEWTLTFAEDGELPDGTQCDTGPCQVSGDSIPLAENPATELTKEYTYESAGTYTLTLSYTWDGGSQTDTITEEIELEEPSPGQLAADLTVQSITDREVTFEIRYESEQFDVAAWELDYDYGEGATASGGFDVDRLADSDAWPWLSPWLSVVGALLDVDGETDGNRDRSPPIIMGIDPDQRALRQASTPAATTPGVATVDTR